MDFEKLSQVLPKESIKWTVPDMEIFLEFIGLPAIYPKFKQVSIDGSCLSQITEEDLKEELQINSKLTLKKLMKWINSGLSDYDAHLLSKMEVEVAPMDLASLTQKPKLGKISSMEAEVPTESIKRSSYKSMPEEQPVNLVALNSNLNHNQNQNQNPNVAQPLYPQSKPVYVQPPSVEVEVPAIEMEESSFVSEAEEEKKKEYELTIHQSDGPQTSFFSVKEEGAKIGRHSSNQILILDESISRFHAEIKFHENEFYLYDTGSTTGTFIKLVGQNEIEDGMILEMGSNQFQAKVEENCLTLQIIEGTSPGYTIDISGAKPVSIGRKQTNLLNFPEDQHLSNTHASIIPGPGNRFFIEDMSTTNGTWLRLSYESEKSDPFALHDKTVFKIGSSQTYVCSIKTKLISQRVNPNACIICVEHDKDCVYMPCKHNAACIRCSKTLKNCPVCRLPIEDYVRIYKH